MVFIQHKGPIGEYRLHTDCGSDSMACGAVYVVKRITNQSNCLDG